MKKKKEILLSTYLNRCNAPAGKLLIRARRVLQAMPSKVGLAVVADIEEYLGIAKFHEDENHD